MLFFFQAEDGIRDRTVTGVQTCALPISVPAIAQEEGSDLETGARLAGQEHLRVRDRGDRHEHQDGAEREPEPAHIRTGKNSRATCSSSGSFFLIMSYSISVSCMVRSASRLT